MSELKPCPMCGNIATAGTEEFIFGFQTKEGIDLARQIPEMVALAQAEAYKEFAEEAKKRTRMDYLIDELLKELVGDKP